MNSRRDFVRGIAGGSLLSVAGKRAQARPPTSIVLSPQASPSEKWAAEQLSLHLERMTSTRIPVITTDTPRESAVIIIGRNAAQSKYPFEVPDGESCLLKTMGDTLVIAGGRERGTMYGVFCFLEKLGCRWFTADVARIPNVRRFSIPRLDEMIRPAFEYREVFFTEAQGRDWSARNRLNGHFHRLDETVGGRIRYQPFAHSFYELVPPEQYFHAHPEYFALVSGTRRAENAQLCLTNAAVVRFATLQVRKWLAEDPGISIVSVSQNDGGGWCECDPCRQMVKSEGGAVSGLLLFFVNQVAREIAISHPGKIIDTLAYQETAEPPSVARPLPNVQIRFCPIDSCQAHSYQSCVYNSRPKEQLAGWARIAPRLVMWQYSINFSHFLLPFPNEHGLISDIRQLKSAGISGIFVEGAVSDGGGGENAELRAYLAARLLWNPEVDVNTEIRGFMEAVYGPAAPWMRRYYDLRLQDGNGHLWIDQNVDAPYLTDRFLKDGRELLKRAHEKVDAGPARRRIERSLLSLDYVNVMRARRFYLTGAAYAPRDLAAARSSTREFVQKAGVLGVTHLREGYPLTRQAQDFDELAREYPAVSLDDGMLAAKIVPELGARIVAMGPSGRSLNILRVPDPGEWSYPNVGGLYFSLNNQRISWRVESATRTTVSLSGQSEQGLDLAMEIRIENGSLRKKVRVVNRAAAPLSTGARFQAELAFGASRKGVIHYGDRSLAIEGVDGRQEVAPQGGCTLSLPEYSIRIRPQGMTGCDVRWSLRGDPRLNITVWNPEDTLVPGQEVSLESEYRPD